MIRILLISFITLLIFSCNKKEPIYEPSARVDPYKIYKEGICSILQIMIILLPVKNFLKQN